MNELEGYTKDKLTIDLVFANVFALFLIVPVGILFGVPYYLIWGFNGGPDTGLFSGFLFTLIVIFGGIVAHELIHGVVWAMFAQKGFRSIKFGILMKMLTPYCHCKEPLKVKHYLLGAIMPALILGFIPAVIAVCIGSWPLLAIGIFFIVAAAGDFMVIHILRNENMNDYAEDHPSEAGCFIYRKSTPLP